MSSPTIDRFSKFVHWHTVRKIGNKKTAEYPIITRPLRRYPVKYKITTIETSTYVVEHAQSGCRDAEVEALAHHLSTLSADVRRIGRVDAVLDDDRM